MTNANSASEIIISANKEIEYYDQLHQEKYRDKNQSFDNHCLTLSNNLASNPNHQLKILNALRAKRFLPAGRVQAAGGANEREVSYFNCSVSQTIEDSMDSIMAALSNAAKILRLGTGIGYNFSNLRPKGAPISKLGTESSGPLSFMQIFDVMASTIASSGHRRGAQMAIIDCSHPNVEEFIDAKMQKDKYRQFNFSVGVTDKFMRALSNNDDWPLIHNGKIYKTIKASYLWEKLINNAYQSAEPGVLFVDRWNQKNNLHYCEHIEACNPCSEQCLPPYGLCLLGSFNLTAYLYTNSSENICFNYLQFENDIATFVEAYDNIFEKSIYAIPEHKEEALNKRRIGLGLTGIANAIELMLDSPSYGNDQFCNILDRICQTLTYTAYDASIELAIERGAFKLYNNDYLKSGFIQTLPIHLRGKIAKYGIRNSHLISYAPCGTISQCAGNTSSGVEPIFYHQVERDVYMKEGKIKVTLQDYNYRNFGFRGKTLEDCNVNDHLNVAKTIQKYTDSAISKTVNVSANCSYEDYEKIYRKAYDIGLKGITVFRPTPLRGAVITEAKKEKTFVDAHCTNGLCSM